MSIAAGMKLAEREAQSMGRRAHLIECAGLLNGRVHLAAVQMDPLHVAGRVSREKRWVLEVDGKIAASGILETESREA